MRRLLSIAIFGTLLTAGLCLAQETEHKQEAANEHKSAEEDGLSVWRWANFVLLAAGLGYLIVKSVPAMFAARSTEIQKGIHEAQVIKQDADKRAAAMDARLASLGSEIETFRTQAKAEMTNEGQRIQQETAVAIKKLEAQAAAEIESAGKAVRNDLKKYAAQLALDLAAQRIRAGLDAGSEAALVDNFIADLDKQGSKN